MFAKRSKFLNSLPNSNFLDWSKPKAFADKKLNLAEKLKFVLGRVEKFVLGRVENILDKGENAATSIFSFSHSVFKRLLSKGQSQDCVVKS